MLPSQRPMAIVWLIISAVVVGFRGKNLLFKKGFHII